MIDLLVTGATVHDGSGAAGFTADVAIEAGRITEIGRITSSARRRIDADGAILTPGFIDIHTHYDGQASWDETFTPSSLHGVTTVVMGNCGVGFAPVEPGQQARLIELMEGVEEIPGAALAEGIRWGWQSFEDYGHALDAMPHSIDFMTLVPHDCLRLFVMGERAARGEVASAEDCAAMQTLLRQALAAGAAGLSLGRTDNHRTARGAWTPSENADAPELAALAGAFEGLPHRVVHAVSDFDCMRGDAADQRQRFDAEYELLETLARITRRPLAFTWLERLNAPSQWQWLAERAERSVRDGLDVRLQAACRPIGILNGLDTSFNPLIAFPSYRAIAGLVPAERAARLREPVLKARILAERPVKLAREGSAVPPIVDQLLGMIDQIAGLMFAWTDGERDARGPDYEPDPKTSFAAVARSRGVGALEAIYDHLSAGTGRNLVYFPIFNYLRGSLDTVHAMLTHPLALHALSDGGAHVATVCDASFPTTLLAHWTRDRTRGPRLPLPDAVQLLSGRNAAHMGLSDRGRIAVGLRADLNVIDYANLGNAMPELVRDLPAGGRRFVQQARGYLATIAGGAVIAQGGALTDARPGRWVRARR